MDAQITLCEKATGQAIVGVGLRRVNKAEYANLKQNVVKLARNFDELTVQIVERETKKSVGFSHISNKAWKKIFRNKG